MFLNLACRSHYPNTNFAIGASGILLRLNRNGRIQHNTLLRFSLYLCQYVKLLSVSITVSKGFS